MSVLSVSQHFLYALLTNGFELHEIMLIRPRDQPSELVLSGAIRLRLIVPRQFSEQFVEVKSAKQHAVFRQPSLCIVAENILAT